MMDLPEIDQRADGLLERLSTTSSAAERRDICWHLEGLKAAARIKEISDRSRPLLGSSVSRCGARGTDGHDSLTCTKGSPHGGSHYDENVQTYFQATEPAAEPTKPAADRLHELVSYLVSQSVEEHHKAGEKVEGWEAAKFEAASKAYDDAATKLQEILLEGGI